MAVTDTVPLAAALRNWARGDYTREAAVELLIRSGKAVYEGAPWLREDDVASGTRLVGIDPHCLLEYAGAWSGGERRVATIAVSLLGGPPVRLDDALPGLDRTLTELVLAAVAHANGSHEHAEVITDGEGRPTGFERLQPLYPWP